MADSLSQDQRQGRLTTPLGPNTLALGTLHASEGLSELFEIRVEAVSEQAHLDFSSTLGLGSSVEFKTQDNKSRFFHGLMTEARWGGTHHNHYVYQLVLRPWLWFLTRTSDCRIFAGLTPIEIIKQVFSDRGFSDFRDATDKSEPPPKLEYCVQYRETDFNFVSRLMETYGIYYFFEHSDGKHTLVLADAKSSHTDLGTVLYNPVGDAGRREKQYVENWSFSRRAQSGVFVLEEYGYKKPSANLRAEKQQSGGYAHDSMEIFEYPHRHVDTEGNDLADKDVGEKLAKYKLEAAQSLDKRCSSMGAAASLFPGALVKLEGHPDKEQDKEYLVTHCAHAFDGQAYRSGGGGGGGYVGHYEMTPSDRPFRAPHLTRKPEITSVQSALVIKDKGGPEIEVDKFGRILVQFYWDRKKKPSRRVRVAQVWAGSNRGALFTPRVGDEVLVAYEESDPDRPIVIGSVYNGTNTVPLTLPDKKVKSGILTQSSTGGGGYNMLLFDDTKGAEKVKLRSQKDLMFKALNNEQRDILNSQTENIGQDETINVGFPAGSGNFNLNALNKVTINVGPKEMPLTQLIMDTSSITLNVGPGGILAQIVMSAAGVTISGTPASQLMVQPSGIMTVTPTLTFTYGPALFASVVTIPTAVIGAGTVGPLPLL